MSTGVLQSAISVDILIAHVGPCCLNNTMNKNIILSR